MMHQRGHNTWAFLIVLLCLSPWPTATETFYSHLGRVCLDDCQPRGLDTKYKCTVRTADDKEELHFCSPSKDVDYRGYKCIDCCETRGYGYYWCNTASRWGYCGEVIEFLRYSTSKYGMTCYDTCATHEYDYYWCHSSKGWDYCSPLQNHDKKGNACRKDHPCGWYDEDYQWCKLEKGGWGKCGQVEPKAMIYRTIYKEDCIDDCQYYGDYFWCHIQGSSWSYCSSLPDFTYKGVPCRSDHKCGDHGYTYNWCYTTPNDDWDYCGVILPGECKYSQPRRTKRKPPNTSNPPQVICTREDNNRRVTTFTAVENHNTIADASRYLQEGLDLINRWDGRGLGQRGNSNLVTSDNLRIDLQGLFNRNNQRYYNLQVQINTQRSNRERSTTVAHIEVPTDTSLEYMRFALRESLQRRARVSLEVTVTPINNNNNNKKNRKCPR